MPINVFADLENRRIVSQFNNVTVRVDEYKSLNELNDLALSELNFDELILDTITANEKLTENLEKNAAEAPEQAHSEETEKPVEIKNLAQLKRALTIGTEFKITSHLRSEVINQTRQVKYADTTGIYSIRPDAPDDTINSANGGRGSYLDWGKASDWEFKNGTCTLYNRGLEHTPENLIISFVVKPRVIERNHAENAPQEEKLPGTSVPVDTFLFVISVYGYVAEYGLYALLRCCSGVYLHNLVDTEIYLAVRVIFRVGV